MIRTATKGFEAMFGNPSAAGATDGAVFNGHYAQEP
jgi:hypothetical protein